MKTILLTVGTLCLMAGYSPKVAGSKGIVNDATVNTVTVVTDKNNTLSFSTMGANRDEVNSLLPNDTLEVFCTGEYTPGMPASKLVQYPQSSIVGGDRDEHGYIGSAGYIWCKVQKDYIRLLEKGVRTESMDDSNASAFIVFSPDSTRLELFFSNNQPNEILEGRGLPSGGYAWNVENNDTKNIRLINGLWTISQRSELIYS